MNITKLNDDFSVCQLQDFSQMNEKINCYFLAKTPEELSLVCKTSDVPSNTINREDGWRGFKIDGVLDFSLIGILSQISSLLADNKISVFAVSTYNTDYIFVKQVNFQKSLKILEQNGYNIN